MLSADNPVGRVRRIFLQFPAQNTTQSTTCSVKQMQCQEEEVHIASDLKLFQKEPEGGCVFFVSADKIMRQGWNSVFSPFARPRRSKSC